MADVLIKGLELPKACSWFDEEGKHHSCRFCLAYICSITGDCIASSVERRHPSCPLVELPPHGRLVDIDRIISESRRNNLSIKIESTDELADFLETYANLDKTDHTVIVEAST